MVNFTFENQGTNTYIVYTIADGDSVDSMSLGMLTNNKISGLAPAMFTQMDSKKYIKYNVTAKVSAKDFFTGAVNQKRLLGVFKGIADAMLSAEDYMIDSKNIVLDLDYIFTDVSTCETYLICLPIESDELSEHNLGAFFKNIMFTTQFDQTENCDYVAKIINFLNSSSTFSILNFKELIDNIGKNTDKVKTIQKPVSQNPIVEPIKAKETPAKVVPQEPRTIPKPQGVSNPLVQTSIETPANSNVTKQGVYVAPKTEKQPEKEPEKKISLFGLLMHYSKENAELYKSQKSAKTAKQSQETQQKQFTGFVVPEETSAQGFAIPGQKPQITPAQTLTDKKSDPSKSVTTEYKDSTPAAFVQPLAQVPQNQVVETPTSKSMNFGETVVLGASNGSAGTTVLGNAQESIKTINPRLIRKKSNETIPINKPVFRIGKEKSYVDYFISDNSAISRSHANVIIRDDNYFVIDTNSTNHTYVNGVMIQSNVETQISDKDIIRLANEDFEFRIY